jgi:hypothetical protein
MTNALSVSESTDLSPMLGQAFEGYDISKTDGSFCLRFSNGIYLQIVPDLSNYDIEDDMMMLTFDRRATYGYSLKNGWKSD